MPGGGSVLVLPASLLRYCMLTVSLLLHPCPQSANIDAVPEDRYAPCTAILL